MNFNIGGNSPHNAFVKKNSPRKGYNDDLSEGENSEDLQMKLEVDRLNDIKNLLYLKGKIITDTKKMLSNRNDFKKLMREKSEADTIKQQQQKEMAKMVYELEKNLNPDGSPLSSPKKRSLNNSKFLSSLNLSITKRGRSTMKDFFNLDEESNIPSKNRSKRNSPILSDFKTQIGIDFDTRSRINSQIFRQKVRNEFNEIKFPVGPNGNPYIIKDKFLQPGTSLHRRSNRKGSADTSEISKSSSQRILESAKVNNDPLPNVHKYFTVNEAYPGRSRHSKNQLSLPEQKY